ncbi:MAG: hypothetical protein L0K56_05170, partial [Corynebacterium sp.]|nr:hypothetical protein [Corynebacterium sp.]
MIRVLVADDQDLVRGALAALLATERDIDVVAEVGRGDEVVDAVREHRVDVALLEAGPSDLEHQEVLQLKRWPELLESGLDWDYPIEPQENGNS